MDEWCQTIIICIGVTYRDVASSHGLVDENDKVRGMHGDRLDDDEIALKHQSSYAQMHCNEP